MIDRRSLLGLIATAPVTAPSAIKASLNTSGLTAPKVMSAVNSVGHAKPCSDQSPGSAAWDLLHEHRMALERRKWADEAVASGNLPYQIASKRSWGAGFRAAQLVEYREAEERLNALSRGGISDELGLRILKAFGGAK